MSLQEKFDFKSDKTKNLKEDLSYVEKVSTRDV